MIPQETIEQVAAANDVLDVIGRTVHLKRAGSNYKGLCPFHKEKSPSFTVNPARQTFKCFGCNVGGTVFKFVELSDNISFPAAVRQLAEKAGIPIIEEGFGGRHDEDQGAGETRRRLLALHAEAAEWFHRHLRKSNEAAAAREYLKSRGLTADVAARWKLGYAPDSWDACLSWATGRGYSRDLLIQGGLFKPPEDEGGGSPARQRGGYDRFRDRLMIPICNVGGEVIAFSGRVLNSETKGPKYLNSPETPLFTKGKVLFGLHLSRKAILDEDFAIVLEGQIDLITAYEAGIRNVVASQGTAFTDRQAQLIKLNTDEAVLCFDADSAGQAAAEKSLPALLAADVTVRVATMPPGEDPDSLIRGRGVEAFAERIGSAQDFFDFHIARLSTMFDLETPKGKTQFAQRMAATVGLITGNMLRENVIGKVSSRLGISPQVFTALLKQQRRPSKARSMPADLTGVGAAAPAVEEAPPFEKPPVAVANLLKLSLADADARGWLREQPWKEVLPKLPGTDLLVGALTAELDPGDVASINAYLATLPPDAEAFLTELLEAPAFREPIVVGRQSWVGLEKSLLNDRLQGRINRMRAPGLSAEEATRLQKEILDLQRRLTDIARL